MINNKYGKCELYNNNGLDINGMGDGRYGILGISIETDFAFLYYSLLRKVRRCLELPRGGGGGLLPCTRDKRTLS